MPNTVDNLIGHYHRMFSFPKIDVLVAENLAVSVIVAVLLSLPVPNRFYMFAALSLIGMTSQAVSSEVAFQLAPSKTLLNRRRSLGLTFASSLLMFPAILFASVGLGLTGSAASIPYASLIIYASMSTYLRYFSSFMYMAISRLVALVVALSQPAIMLLGVDLLDDGIFGQPILIPVSIIIAIIFAEFSIYLFKSRALKTLRLDGLSLARAFFAGWMGREPEKLEEALEVESSREDVKVEVFAVKRAASGELKTVLVAPQIHAGPFRNLGSSDLPGVLAEKIEAELHVPIFVFHGAVSHEKDLVHSRDARIVAEEIIRIIKLQPSEDLHHGSMMIRNQGRMVGGLSFDGQQLVWISLAPFLSEDLPFRLQLQAEAHAAEYGVRKTSLLDTHSCLAPTQPTPKVFKSLEDQLREVIIGLSKKKPAEPKLGVAEINVEGFSSEEIGGLGGVAAFFQVDSDIQGILLFDSNNMTLELRQVLDERLVKDLGEPVEIFTTDTHVLVGIRVKKDYSPLGEKTEKHLILSQALEALRKAKSDIEPVTITPITVNIKGIAVLGTSGIETLGRATNVMVSLARRLLPVTITGCALLTLLAIYLAT